MIKVLYVHQDGLMTGSAISLYNMIKGFAPNAITAEIIFFSDGPAIEKFSSLGIKCHIHKSTAFWTTPGPRWYQRGNLIGYKALIPNLALRKQIKSISPDIIHINDKAALSAGISSVGLGIPIIQHLRSTNYICRTKINKWLSVLFIELYATLKIAISEDEAVDFKSKNTKISFNSVDFDEINHAFTNPIQLNNQKINIGWLGRFSTSKGAWDFIKIAGILNKKYPQLQFHMLAPIPSENEKEIVDGKIVFKNTYLKTLINQENLNDNLILHGYKKEFLSVVASMNIMVNCNRLGALGRQAFETVCLGIPTIVTAKYPRRSSVLNNDVCFIEKEGDLTSISNAITKLIEDSVLRAHLATKGRAWGASQFDNHKQSLKIYNLYRNLLS